MVFIKQLKMPWSWESGRVPDGNRRPWWDPGQPPASGTSEVRAEGTGSGRDRLGESESLA